CLQGYNIPYNF
nr:immunoglobulin light chain junction region [Macaca mulatta]MOV78469.1 immunoglobulin light chain junction region [Macaca mulatta]MOV78522.1 immunoglobulin light chain junction region [Macaca mulatta]MOV79226.1 immunoglobulin light chain junction region [Macaca mulatta]MOV79666.1 immunoglobulin light chain junction region [Macaca mulatta]